MEQSGRQRNNPRNGFIHIHFNIIVVVPYLRYLLVLVAERLRSKKLWWRGDLILIQKFVRDDLIHVPHQYGVKGELT
jgi:hypothetical protein